MHWIWLDVGGASEEINDQGCGEIGMNGVLGGATEKRAQLKAGMKGHRK